MLRSLVLPVTCFAVACGAERSVAAIDERAPTVSIDSIVRVDATTVHVYGQATDDVGLDRLEYFVTDPDEVNALDLAGQSDAFDFAIGFRAPYQPHDIILRAFDRAGRWGQTGKPAMYWGPPTIAPTMKVFATDDPTTLIPAQRGASVSYFTLVTVGSHGAIDLKTAEGVVDEGTANEAAFPAFIKKNDVDRSGGTTVGPLSNGVHTITVRLTDDSGNVGRATQSITVNVPAVTYDLIPLGALGGTDSDALDMNDAGTIVGWTQPAGGSRRAVIWESRAPRFLGGTTTGASEARALNEAGDVAGQIEGQVVMWPLGAEPQPRGPLTCCAEAADINASRVIVGNALPPAARRPFADVNGSVLMMSMPFNFEVVVVRSINDAGYAVGTTSGNVVRWPSVSVLGESRCVASGFALPAIAEACVAVKGNNTYVLASGWSPMLERVGTLSGTPLQSALATARPASVNEAGVVVAFDPGTAEVYLWSKSKNTSRVAFTSTGWVIDRVNAINISGEIVAHGRHATGATGALLLRPR